MEIKRLTKTQGDLVYDLFNQYRVFYKQPSDLQAAKDFIDERLSAAESVIYVAIDPELKMPVGFTQLYPKYSSVRLIKNWLLNDLYVADSARKQGVGELLLQTAIDFAKSQDARFVHLSTATDNYTAQRLYERIGFIREAPETDFYDYKIAVV